MKICIATENRGKLIELQSLLISPNLQLILASDMGIDLHVAETGTTYAQNAALKAAAYANATRIIALGDDSGLEVQALQGAPGLYSKRYSSDPLATDADRRKLLITNLRAYPKPWKARFTCTVCIQSPDGERWFTSGECRGEIIETERGEGGFGYDRIFECAGIGKTMAELSMAEKNVLSHRARAVLAALPILERLASEEK